MIEIIPGILEREWDEIEKKINIIAGLTEWVHIDVSDGRFTPNVTWDEPRDLSKIKEEPKIEIHLMTSQPDEQIDKWLDSLVGRIIIHYESKFSDIKGLIQRIKGIGREIVIAFNPTTPWQGSEEILALVDGVLFLAVSPGYSGQEFNKTVLEKISSLRASYPNIVIEVDGGVRPPLIKDLLASGATRFVSTSYVFSAGNPKEAIREYQEEIKKYL